MKKITIIILLLICSTELVISQVAGNVNYQYNVRYPDRNINVNFNNPTEFIISVKGLHNVKADAYIAMFSVTQVGKSIEEVNELLDERISKVKTALKNQEENFYVDMISFVPMYEYEKEKKLFSKDNYNEIPIGFELKKNIHIKYKNAGFINELVRICSIAEIYDLVKVDYYSAQLPKLKEELANKSIEVIKNKMRRYETLLGVDLDTLQKEIVDGYKILYPIESYKQYQAHSSQSLQRTVKANVNNVQKQTTFYYNSVMDKEFDVVINPVVQEPVIQIMYEMKVKLKQNLTQKDATKKYMFITPDGALRELNIK